MATALVLLSGGQDSTTCLAWALERFDKVETIGFHYGQRHAVEMDCRKAVLLHLRSFPAWGNRLANDHVVDLGVIKQLGTTAMTDDIRIEMQKSGLPNTFAPGRNLLLHRRRSCGSTRRRRGRSPSSSAARRSSTSSSSTRTAATSATGHAGTTGATAAVPVPPAS